MILWLNSQTYVAYISKVAGSRAKLIDSPAKLTRNWLVSELLEEEFEIVIRENVSY